MNIVKIDTPIPVHEVEHLARIVNCDPRYRVLTRVPEMRRFIHEPACNYHSVVGIIDVETSGLNPASDDVIELALMRVMLDAGGRIVGHDLPISWLEQPSKPLDPKITSLTGLTDAMLAGAEIDRGLATNLLSSCDFLFAHHARFDVAFVEKLLPGIAGMAWACSCFEIDWLELGFTSRALPQLLTEHGYFNDGHRAAADVWSTFTLLKGEDLDGVTPLQRLVRAAGRQTLRVEANGAPKTRKDDLRLAGYRWDADRGVWYREIEEDQLAAEAAWLRTLNSYNPHVFALGPTNRFRPFDATLIEPYV